MQRNNVFNEAGRGRKTIGTDNSAGEKDIQRAALLLSLLADYEDIFNPPFRDNASERQRRKFKIQEMFEIVVGLRI